MKKNIQRYLAVLLLLLSAVSAQAQKHKLTVVSTVGSGLSLRIYSHTTDGNWDFFNNNYKAVDNYVSGELATGDSVKIEIHGLNGWGYTYMECEGQKIFEGREVMHNSDDWPIFIMPDHDVTINAYAEFDPEVPEEGWEYGGEGLENPESPGTNSWNAATGELFINYFQKAGQAPGGNSIGGFHLYAYRTQFGFQSTDVKTLTVAGEVGRSRECFSDLGSYNALPNAEKLDLRHTFGHTSYQGVWENGVNKQEDVLEIQLNGMPQLKQLILPSNIKYIGWWQLPQNSVLEAITLYATVPPAICISEYEYSGYMLYGFDRIPESCILYVPEQSVAAYKADGVWGTRFADILPIPEGEAENITVDLPDNFTDGRYEGMSLLLCNARTGEQTKYIVDERPSYIFYAQTCEEPYTAQLQSAQGVLIATTDTLTLSGQPMEMTFKTVQPMHTVQLTVQTPAEEEGGTPTDVTDQTTIVWMDAMGNRIATGNTLARQVEGTRLLYGITLPTDLAARYGVPPRTELLVKEATAQTVLTLSQPDSVILSGKVTDTAGKPISMATVTASLMMNGTVGKVFTASTDALGRYELTALTGDLTLSASASGYVAVREAVSYSSLVSLASLSSPSSPSSTASQTSTTSNFDLTLAPLSGPTIHYDFTYTAATTADEEATTLPYYSDYQNVAVAAYNETTGEALDSLMVQYPEVQLLDGAKAGDRIRLTASSLKDAFMPVEVTVTLTDEEEKADSVTFALKELGGVEVSFLRTSNQAVTAVLYDADGLLCRQETFAEASLTLTGLKDGNYTVVTMGSDPLLSKMLYLSDYTAVGMEADKDYVSNKVKVESGIISQVTNDLIPTLYADPFYYTDDAKTLFMSNKTEVSTSCNVTLRAEIGFKDDIKERVSNVRLLVDYPTGMAEFVEGSSMTGTKMVRATMEDGHLSIPVENDYLDEPTRFILTAIDQGTLMASAKVQFDIDGRTVTQPIGTASCDVKYMTIVAPEAIYKLSFPVYGTAPAFCPIRVYAGNDILVGETQSLADGSWNMHVELSDCPNLATIPVYAVITTKQGREAKTETVNITYDQNMIRPLHVLMFPPLWTGEGDRNGYGSLISDAEKLCIDFDYENPMSLSEQWYSAYVHTSQPFLFEIIFNTTDSTKVKNVILEYTTVNGEVDYLEAEYDGTTGHWMCSVNLQNDAVSSVDVGYLTEGTHQIDSNILNANANIIEALNDNIQAFKNEAMGLLEKMGKEGNATKRYELFREFLNLVGFDASQVEGDVPEDMTFEEALAQAQATVEELQLGGDLIGGASLYDVDFGENMHITHAAGLNVADLLAEGYEEIENTDGHICYQLVAEDRTVFVDFQNDVCIEVTGEQAALLAKIRNATKLVDIAEAVNDFVSSMNTWITLFNQGVEILKGSAAGAQKLIIPLLTATDKSLRALEATAKGGRALTAAEQSAVGALGVTKWILDGADKILFCVKQYGLDPKQALELFSKSPANTAISNTVKSSLNALKGLGTALSYVTVVNDLVEGTTKVTRLMQLYNLVPNPYACTNDYEGASTLKDDIAEFAVKEIFWFGVLATADLAGTEAMNKGALAIPAPPFGLGISAMLGGVAGTLIKMGGNLWNSEIYSDQYQKYNYRLNNLDCDHEMTKKRIRAQYLAEKRQTWNRAHRKVRVAVDPSGYVYEAVADNRVENATATIYFKQTGEDEYGDLHDEVVKWNAAEFRQENPQMTDAEGKYAWDVPQGLWQVKIEKEGYETAYSDWLPVPPPQLDINIPLVRNTLPDVQTARAYEDGVEVTFNEYMRPQSLTTERLILSQNGEQVPCRIEQQDRSQSYDKKAVYASRVKVRAESPLANGSKVQLTVRRQVEAYNGLQMQKDYQQEFTVVSEVYAIGTDSIVEVAKGEERIITIHAFPAAAAQGMKVTAKSVIGTIATVTDEATFDASGEAHLTVAGKVGGQTVLVLSLENSKVTAQSVIMVEDPKMLPVYAPTASHISGTYVKEGEAVTLSCETKDATIWYTTDGTCPCDENGTRVKYTSPISITKAVTIRAYAVKGDDASRVVTFNYGIYDPVGISGAAATEEAEVWYTVGGVRLATKPTAKGVYILNGKKVVLK